jgi:hypothetical protein
MKNKYLILDNGGETYDRYTIVNLSDGDMIGANETPFHPMGFGQYCGNVADNYWNVAYGYSWRNGCDKKLMNKRIKFAIDNFKADCSHIGKEIEYKTLPIDVQTFIKKSFE